MKVVCWSGPRNLSTAMMYSFGNRADFSILDEPFYAAFLRQTGIDHPIAAEVMAAHVDDWGAAASLCAADGAPHVYQKHMTHHILPETPLDWARDAEHVFLIRHPARVLASYHRLRASVTLEDIGVTQQLALYERFGGIIIDSEDIRADPRGMLAKLCADLGITFDPKMLKWPAGGHPADGIWARHWYKSVHASTGFAGPEGPLPHLDSPISALCDEALPIYRFLRSRRITI